MSGDEDGLGWLDEEEAPATQDTGDDFQNALDWLQDSDEEENSGEEDGLDWLGGGGDDEESAPALVEDDEEDEEDGGSIFSMALDDFFEDMEAPAEAAPVVDAGKTQVTTSSRRKPKRRRSQDEQKIDRVMNTLVRYLTRKEAVREGQLDTIFRLTVGKIVDPISAEVIVVYFADEARELSFAHLFYSRSLFKNNAGLEGKFNSSLEELGQLKIKPDTGILGRAIKTRKAVTSLNAAGDQEFLNHLGKATGYNVRTMITVPIVDSTIVEENRAAGVEDPFADVPVFGAIQVMNKDPESGEEFFNFQDLRLVETLSGYLGRLIHVQRDPELERSEEEIAGYYARMAKTEVVDPKDTDRFVWDKRLFELVGLENVKKYLVLPVKTVSGKGVQVIMVNPMDMNRRSQFESATDLIIEEAFVSVESKILEVIAEQFGGSGPEVAKGDMSDLITLLDEESPDAKKAKEGEEETENTDTGLMKLVNSIIEQAYVRGASDIHIEPHPELDLKVRFRIDGVCADFTMIPRRFSRALVSRLKIMADLDIAERRKPQDGKIKFKNFGKLDLELRVATIPTVGGQEDCVMRILAASKPMPLDDMGFSPENLTAFKHSVKQPYGLVLVVGPTGSGKTTTLHSGLGFINKPETKIWTAEDPVEITQYGLRQVQVKPKIGFTFEVALRSFLRCDPDVIMIGEMRDKETAEAGIEAALTGHMVFSTLHTNSAPETVTRLLDLGLDPYSFGDSLLGVLAQRLLRRLCKKCKESYEPTAEELESLKTEYGNDDGWERFKCAEDLNLARRHETDRRSKKCPGCGGSGYKGRMGIHEYMVNSDELRSMIYAHAKVSDLRDHAQNEGMTTLKQDGIRKVLGQGLTDIFEVRRVCIK
ncbi:MAG: GspE/PulE family protein [Planctomycetes bacterium]|nr:GspE/PulE family protein [Planctomycetota bacterium]